MKGGCKTRQLDNSIEVTWGHPGCGPRKINFISNFDSGKRVMSLLQCSESKPCFQVHSNMHFPPVAIMDDNKITFLVSTANRLPTLHTTQVARTEVDADWTIDSANLPKRPSRILLDCIISWRKNFGNNFNCVFCLSQSTCPEVFDTQIPQSYVTIWDRGRGT